MVYNPGGGCGRTLLELELFDARFIGGDGGALDADRVLLDSLGGIEGDLVVGLVAVFEAEVVVLEVDVEVGVDELVLDVLPDDAGHFVAVELDDGVLDLDFGSHGARKGLDSAKRRAEAGADDGDAARKDASGVHGEWEIEKKKARDSRGSVVRRTLMPVGNRAALFGYEGLAAAGKRCSAGEWGECRAGAGAAEPRLYRRGTGSAGAS